MATDPGARSAPQPATRPATRPATVPAVPLGDDRLPDDPSLEWLRKQAKDLRRQHPDQPLATAQLRVARQHGFTSWTGLKRHVEVVRSYRRTPDEVPEQPDRAAEFLRLVCLTYGSDDPGRRARASAMVRADPSLGGDDVWVAAARCDVATLRRALTADPTLAGREGGPFAWVPLVYLAFARLDPSPSEPQTLAATAALLDAGADPNAGYLWHGLPTPFTLVTGALGSGEGGERHPPHPHGLAVARLLLERGADPNDAQALYNRMFGPDDAHLELLLEFGLGRGDGGPWRRRLGQASAAPGELLLGQLAWAASHGLDRRVELLAAHGVDLDAPLREYGGAGRPAHEIALAAGLPATAGLLVRLGAGARELPATERLVAAVSVGDRAEVGRLRDADDGLLARARASRPGLLSWLADRGDLEAVRLAVELGWDVDRRARTDVPSDQQWETALHAAARNGDVAMVRLLVELGADTEVADHRFAATALQWAEHFDQPAVGAVLRGRHGDGDLDGDDHEGGVGDGGHPG